MSSITGTLYKLSSFGESHGKSVGAIIDGCPSNIKIDLNQIQDQLNRRKPNQSNITTSRKEKDRIQCFSGLENNTTLGSPIMIMVDNIDHNPDEYKHLKNVYRPSHGDYTYHKKYKIVASSGSGRASARETIARIIGGNIAEQVLSKILKNFKIIAYTSRVGDIEYKNPKDKDNLTRAFIDKSIVRCPDQVVSNKMQKHIEKIKNSGDSTGGEITCEIYGIPAGIGEPVFNKLHANLAKAMLSIPSSRYFVMADSNSYDSFKKTGSEYNDSLIVDKNNQVSFNSNNSGGINAGISSGDTIIFKVGFKPPSTIKKNQSSLDHDLKKINISTNRGRHDPCVVPRAVAIVESMATMVILDSYLINNAYNINYL